MKTDGGDVKGNGVDCDGDGSREVDGSEALAGVFDVLEDGEGGDADDELLQDVVVRVTGRRLAPCHATDLQLRTEETSRGHETLGGEVWF